MAKKLFVVVPVTALLLGVAVQQVWSHSAAASRASSAPVSVAAVVDAKPETASFPSSTPIERTDVTPAGSVTPFDPNPLSVPPWDARMLVVDEQQQAVADAVITIWAAKRIPADPRRGDNGNRDDSYSGRLGELLHRLHTDAEGFATVRLAIECAIAVASKEGFGHTSDLWLNCHRAAGTARKFTLQVPIALHGVVLRADGLPAGRARVSATGRTLMQIDGTDPADPDPVTTDAAGRFEMQVHDLARYTLHAELDGERTFSERVEIRDRRAPEVVLAFPGGITIEGLVVNADGRPVANASIVAWREYIAAPQADPDNNECVDTDADAYGCFTLAVMRHARYQLIGAAKGHANSTPTWTETTVERPHANVRLELQRFAAIRGRVVHGDGSAFAGVRVEAVPETGQWMGARDSVTPDQESMFGKRPETTAGEDGTFALAVHPGTTWTVRAWTGSVGHRLHFDAAAVAPGSSDVLIRIDDQDAAGCMVHGTVVRADGEPVGAYRVCLVDLAEAGDMPSGHPPIGRDMPADIEGDHFSLGPLPRGRQFCLRVLPQDRAGTMSPNTGPMAPLQVGPFTTDRPQVDLVFRLVGWGELPVRVLAADGLPPKGARVVAVSNTVFPVARILAVVDDDGLAVLRRCIPGSNRVAGFFEQPLRVGKEPSILFDQTLEILPGRNREVVIRLPAK